MATLSPGGRYETRVDEEVLRRHPKHPLVPLTMLTYGRIKATFQTVPIKVQLDFFPATIRQPSRLRVYYCDVESKRLRYSAHASVALCTVY